MVESIASCKYCFYALTKLSRLRLRPTPCLGPYKCYSNKVSHSSSTEDFIENLVLEDGIKREANLTKYFENVNPVILLKEALPNTFSENKIDLTCDLTKECNFEELVHCIEKEAVNTKIVPNEKLKYLLVYFTKDGNVNGVKAIQSIVEKHNIVHFKSQAEYNHYLAEAFWITGKMHTSLNLFSVAYDNVVVRPKVKVMLPNLFPLLSAQHSVATLSRVIHDVEEFAIQKRDNLILACLWRELFLSTWFSDQELSSKLLLKNKHILKSVQWMVPTMGRTLLKSHRVEDFYRLIQFTLENGFKEITESLIRLLFEYYYIHQNIERCTAVVKYSSSLNSCLTEDQNRRYVSLLLKSKDAARSKSIVKKPQDLNFKF